jgi:hypothetical protein
LIFLWYLAFAIWTFRAGEMRNLLDGSDINSVPSVNQIPLLPLFPCSESSNGVGVCESTVFEAAWPPRTGAKSWHAEGQPAASA